MATLGKQTSTRTMYTANCQLDNVEAKAKVSGKQYLAFLQAAAAACAALISQYSTKAVPLSC